VGICQRSSTRSAAIALRPFEHHVADVGRRWRFASPLSHGRPNSSGAEPTPASALILRRPRPAITADFSPRCCVDRRARPPASKAVMKPRRSTFPGSVKLVGISWPVVGVGAIQGCGGGTGSAQRKTPPALGFANTGSPAPATDGPESRVPLQFRAGNGWHPTHGKALAGLHLSLGLRLSEGWAALSSAGTRRPMAVVSARVVSDSHDGAAAFQAAGLQVRGARRREAAWLCLHTAAAGQNKVAAAFHQRIHVRRIGARVCSKRQIRGKSPA